MLGVVTFKWTDPTFKTSYTSDHVNIVRRMVARHYPYPHRFYCVTDDPRGLDDEITPYPLWDDYAEVPNPTWPNHGPSCYRRLKLFDSSCFGDRFVCLDLDLVITNDLSPLWNRPEDCVTYSCPGLAGRINGAMFLQTALSRKFVWDMFDPIQSPIETHRLGYVGSDQAWMNACLQHCSGKWTKSDGLYDYTKLRPYRQQPCQTPRMRRKGRRAQLPSDIALPDNARIVFFHGHPKPWECREEWIHQHYR